MHGIKANSLQEVHRELALLLEVAQQLSLHRGSLENVSVQRNESGWHVVDPDNATYTFMPVSKALGSTKAQAWRTLKNTREALIAVKVQHPDIVTPIDPPRVAGTTAPGTTTLVGARPATSPTEQPMTTPVVTRAEYMKSHGSTSAPQGRANSHDSYYRQFVSENTLRQVKMRFGVDELRAAMAKDEHFNSIPLKHWDALTAYQEPGVARFKTLIDINRVNIKAAGESVTRAVLVCIAKRAAAMIVEASLTSDVAQTQHSKSA